VERQRRLGIGCTMQKIAKRAKPCQSRQNAELAPGLKHVEQSDRVERRLPRPDVAGSMPVSRSIF